MCHKTLASQRDVGTECYTVVATSQENPWGPFRVSYTPEFWGKEIHALLGDQAYQISGSEGCLLPLWPPGNYRESHLGRKLRAL